MQQQPKKPLTIPQPGFVELRGASGRLYGYYDPQRNIVEFKRGAEKEVIHLRDYQQVK